VQYGAPVKVRGSQTASNVYPGFSICLDLGDGNRERRSYAFLTNIVRFAGKKPCEMPAVENPQVSMDEFVASADQPEDGAVSRPSIFNRIKARLDNLRKRWTGK